MQADFDRLLEAVLPFAQQQLKSRGRFLPFGAVITTEGEVSAVTQGGSSAGLESLYNAVRRTTDVVRAAAFVADVRVNGARRIRVELEHSEGACLTMVMKYNVRRDASSMRYGQFEVAAGAPHVWPDR